MHMRKAIERFPGLEKICRRSVMRLDHTLKGVDPLKVVFSCFLGRFYGDSPRCISERLHQRCPEARIVWLFNREAMARVRDELPDYVKPVSFKSREALTELATARVWVDNFTKHNYISLDPRRQAYIQTWHGDRAIKKICYDLEVSGDRRIEEQCARVVTGSRFGEDMFRTAFRYKGEYIRSGSPRNDILLRGDPKERDRVRRALGIGPDTGVLLYAPTYRDNASVLPRSAQMDLERTLGCLEEVTGRRWICLFRAHYKSRGIDLQAVADRLVDVTKYEEMAELLLAADVCLTDYSSCAMDFILQDRPALFYIPDWEEYVSTRGVYFDVHDAPFFIASDQCELETLIQSLTPGKVRENCAAIREWFGYYESGRATDAVCDYIIDVLNSKNH